MQYAREEAKGSDNLFKREGGEALGEFWRAGAHGGRWLGLLVRRNHVRHMS